MQNKRYRQLTEQERESNSQIRLFIPFWRNYFTVTIDPSMVLFVKQRSGSGLWAARTQLPPRWIRSTAFEWCIPFLFRM